MSGIENQKVGNVPVGTRSLFYKTRITQYFSIFYVTFYSQNLHKVGKKCKKKFKQL